MLFPAHRSAVLLAVLVAASPPGNTTVAAQQANARVDSLFSFATPTTPGCAVAAIKDGQVLYACGYGLADIEHQVVTTPQTPFYMRSVSKQFAAGAINLLVLDGKLSLRGCTLSGTGEEAPCVADRGDHQRTGGWALPPC